MASVWRHYGAIASAIVAHNAAAPLTPYLFYD
jgi:hypothetical protein